MPPGTGNGYMKQFAALRVRRWIALPDERGIIPLAIEDNAVKLLPFTLVHVHDVDALQVIAAREDLFLRKRSVEGPASSAVGAIGEPQLGEVGRYPLPTVERYEII